MPKPFVEYVFFPFYNFAFFGKNQMSIHVWIYFWVIDSIPDPSNLDTNEENLAIYGASYGRYLFGLFVS